MSEVKTEEAEVEEEIEQLDEPPAYQPDPPDPIDLPEPVYGDPDAEAEESPMEANPEYYARAAETGVYGDPDAPEGYWVDDNFRPNPLDVGSFTTTDHQGNDPNDLTQHSGLFANAGTPPEDIEQWPLEPDQAPPEDVEPGPDHPEPTQAAATDYDPSLGSNVRGRHADPGQQVTTQVQADHARATREAHDPARTPTAQEVKESAEKTAQAAEKTVEKATHATKATKKANPAGTKDTALEDPA